MNYAINEGMNYGIIRYSINDGDKAAFDGWYSTLYVATSIYKSWCETYPNDIVALVKREDVRWTQ